ncbi:nucleotidyltransferase domain-containing protein [Chloroflexi bacterium CFX6]|nr:nucleotidyltransferase domain-containing protein [Chloroflexi bacterium CFX6]
MVTEKPLALKLVSKKEAEALQAFIQRLLAELEGRVFQIILFGSKARGDSAENSDIDVLILAGEENWQLQKNINKIASRIDLDYDVLLNPFLIAEERWRQMSKERFSICRNVERDGITLFSRS